MKSLFLEVKFHQRLGLSVHISDLGLPMVMLNRPLILLFAICNQHFKLLDNLISGNARVIKFKFLKFKFNLLMWSNGFP